MAKGKAYKKWYRKHYTADGKRKDPKPEFRGGILEALAKGERENNSKLVESVSGLTHAVHGYFIYECEECGAIYKMYLDKGLEDRVQDEQYPEKHNVACTLTLLEGYALSTIKKKVQEVLEAYFLEMRKVWENGGLIVRISQIENRILGIDGVIDVLNTTINGNTSNITLEQSEIPLLGTLEVS